MAMAMTAMAMPRALSLSSTQRTWTRRLPTLSVHSELSTRPTQADPPSIVAVPPLGAGHNTGSLRGAPKKRGLGLGHLNNSKKAAKRKAGGYVKLGGYGKNKKKSKVGR